jgi:hypothetical protein
LGPGGWIRSTRSSARCRQYGALALLATLFGCATDEGYLTLAATRPVSLDTRTILELDIEQLPSYATSRPPHG